MTTSKGQEQPPQRNPEAAVPQAEAAWEWFRSLGSPKYWVAPMVDQSELAFRQLCMRNGATGGYTPMLHARLFCNTPAYRAEHFTTTQADRPLLAQFCANDPEVLLRAAQHVEPFVDGVDLNLGCPQRIAKKGRYGAFLMDNLPLVEEMVRHLATHLRVPVTVKIRKFDELERTLEYALMLERAGASLVAIHGRTREQKAAGSIRADWDAIRAVKQALRVPVLGNGNIQTLQDCQRLMEYTDVDGVMSAESLLEDPALFSPRRLQQPFGHVDGPQLLLEYCDLLEVYPAPFRMVKGHAFKLLGPWLSEFTDLREELNMGGRPFEQSTEPLRALTHEVLARIEQLQATEGRSHPVPRLSERKLAAMAKEAALAAAIEEQEREAAGLAELEGAAAPGGDPADAAAAAAAAAEAVQQQQEQQQQQPVSGGSDACGGDGCDAMGRQEQEAALAGAL